MSDFEKWWNEYENNMPGAGLSIAKNAWDIGYLAALEKIEKAVEKELSYCGCPDVEDILSIIRSEKEAHR